MHHTTLDLRVNEPGRECDGTIRVNVKLLQLGQSIKGVRVPLLWLLITNATCGHGTGSILNVRALDEGWNVSLHGQWKARMRHFVPTVRRHPFYEPFFFGFTAFVVAAVVVATTGGARGCYRGPNRE